MICLSIYLVDKYFTDAQINNTVGGYVRDDNGTDMVQDHGWIQCSFIPFQEIRFVTNSY